MTKVYLISVLFLFFTGTPKKQPVIYINFSGSTVTGTLWNKYTDTDTIEMEAYHIADAGKMVILKRVDSVYKPFGIRVTMDKNVYQNAHPLKRIEVVVSASWYNILPVGGVALFGSFTWPVATPAFVFPNILSNRSETLIAHCIAHEVGHSLGLQHQAAWNNNGMLLTSYNKGTDKYAPVMGSSDGNKELRWWVGRTDSTFGYIQNDIEVVRKAIGN